MTSATPLDRQAIRANSPAPAISLILATVGRCEQLDRLFDTFAAQTFRDFEVIVVDQNDDTRLDAPVSRAIARGVTVRHIRHSPPNLAAARNAGIDVARGAWLGFPDDDCWYDARMLERLSAHMTGDTPPSGVIARWIEQGEPLVDAPALSWERSSNFRDVAVSSITLFFQRRLSELIGGFDGRLGVGQWFGAGEEHDFVLRALRQGAVFAHAPDAEVHHAVGPASPPSGAAARMAARIRARGAGALYAKHRLGAWVIARGLLAPVLRPLLKASWGPALRHGFAVSHGRLEGWLRWRTHELDAAPVACRNTQRVASQI